MLTICKSFMCKQDYEISRKAFLNWNENRIDVNVTASTSAIGSAR